MARQGRSQSLGFASQSPAQLTSERSSFARSCAHIGCSDELLKTPGADLDDVAYLYQRACPGFVCQQDLYARLSQDFAASEDVHGAINVRVLLWGPGGHGKREMATHFARSQALTRSRTILWIEASTPVTFVRDLRLAYELMTGKVHPSGVSVRWQLFRISQALSECKSRWFMVVLDFNPDLQSASLNETGIDLASYLPNGQILMTYSPKLQTSDDLALRPTEVPLEFSIHNISRWERMAKYDPHFAHAMMNRTQLAVVDDIPCSELSLKHFSLHLLSAALGSSVARLSNLSLDQYRQALHGLISRSTSRRHHPASPASMLTTFAWTMEMLMEVLRDVDSNAEELLIALAPACSRDIPLSLIQRLRGFKNMSYELEDAIELLQSASVINVKVLPNGDKFISMHSMVHNWLNAKFRRSRNDGDPGFRRSVRHWVSVLEQELPELQHESHKHKYWMLLHLVLTVIKNAEHIDYRGSALICLLRKVATFMSDFLVTPLEANRLLARALYLTADLRSEDADFSIELERLKLHCERSRLCALLGDYPQARQEVDYAQSCLSSLESPDVKKTLQHELNEELIELLLRQGNHVQARLMISNVLAAQPELSPERKGKLHYWAVCCANDDRVSLLTALQHSHLAMSYWQTLPEEERWGSKSFSMIAWVDAHTDLLLQMDRGRGALIFMPKLLDHYIEQCPPTTEAIWRVAYCLVRENIGILELEAAEEVACRVLTLCDFTQLEGLSLAWALTMLHVLGAMFARTGRYLESEGIFRTCLTAIELRRPPRVSGQGEFPALNLWLELCHTLLVQGKVEQAEAARAIAVEKGFNNLKGPDWKKVALEPHMSLQKIYSRALQAARDRRDGVYNVEDHLLEASWPKTFSIAIRVLGDPFEHIKNGVDGVSNVLIPTGETLGEYSLVLELLGFHFDSSDSDTSSKKADEDPNWHAVFEVDLSAVGDHLQKRMDDFWRWCNCRRRRKRTSSIGYDVTFHNRIIRNEEERKEKLKSSSDQSSTQKLITDIFPKLRKYAPPVCSLTCPCVKANAESVGLISTLESERLHIWRPSNPADHAAKHDAYMYALKQYRYRFGPRPAVPYGMSFITRWRKPKGPTEPNGNAKRQHEFFWAPDFVFSGDSQINWGFLGQDENYLFSNPAMTIRSNGAPGGLPDLPNIVITSHRLGEEVRGNIDLFNIRGRKKYIQTNIKDYLDEEDEVEANDVSRHPARESDLTEPMQPQSESPARSPSPVPDRPRRRRGRIPHRVPLPTSRSGSESSSAAHSRSSSLATADRANDHGDDNRKVIPKQRTASKVKLFGIDSLQSLGPVFSIDDFNEQSFQAMRANLPFSVSHTVTTTVNTNNEMQQPEQIPNTIEAEGPEHGPGHES